MAEAGKVWVPVLPSMRGFVSKVTANVKRIGDVGVKINPEVDGKQLKAKVGAAAKAANTTVRAQLDLDIKEALAKRKLLAAELEKLGQMTPSPEVDLKTARATAALGRLDARIESLSQKRVDVQAQIDADTDAASRKIGTWAKVMSGLHKVEVKVNVDADNAIIQTARLASALKTVTMPAVLLGAAPYVLSLASSLYEAAGAAALLPAAIGAGALAIGTFKVGMSGVGEALKYAFDPEKAEEFAKALGKLAPSAQASVLAIKGLGPAWDGLKLDVQGRLFDGLAERISRAGSIYIPILRGALGGLATDLNGQVKAAFDEVFLVDSEVANVTAAFGHLQVGVGGVFSAIAPLAQVFTTLFVHGAPYIARFGLAVGEAAGAFSLFIANASRAGLIEVWINNALAVLRQLWQVAVNVGSILGSMFAAADASGGSFLTTLVNITGRIATALQTPAGAAGLTQFFGIIRQLVAAFIERLVILWPLISSLATAFFRLLDAASPILDVVFQLVVAALTPLADVLAWMAPVLGPVIAALWLMHAASAATAIITGVLHGAMWAIQGVMIAVRIATGLWAAAQWLLNVALSANPIALVVLAIAALVAGVLYAYTHFEWFRTAVDAVGAVFVWLWQTVLQPVVSFLVDVLGAAITWISDHWTLLSTILGIIIGPIGWVILAFTTFRDQTMAVLSAIGTGLSYLGLAITVLLVTPFYLAWQGIVAVATWAWETVLSPIWEAIKLGLQLLGAAFTYLWMVYVVPAWNGIVAAATAAWNWVNNTVFTPLKAGLQVVGNFFLMLWNTYVVPAWNGIMAAAGAAWNWVNSNVFAPLRAGLQLVGNFFMMLWNNYVVPAWNGIMGMISRAWDFIQGVFDIGKRAVDSVGQAFQFVADWIGRAWATIREAARGPIQFVVDIVYNNGIRPVWNGIAGLFGMAQLGPVTMATGGVLPGYAPGRDTIPALLSRGEGVLVPEAVRALGPGFVGWANSTFSSGRSDGGQGTPQGGRFARGGVARFAEGGIAQDIWEGITGIGDFFVKAFTDPAGAVRDLFSGIVGDANRIPGLGQPWSDAPKEIVPKTIEAVIAKVKKWIEEMAAAGAGGNWMPVILQALAITGDSPDNAWRVARQIQIESGGNPRAINLWDINAKRGTPSKGLIQTIDPTFQAYRDRRLPNDPYHPLANLVAGIRYAKSRYGSIANIWPKTMGYDVGGVLPPGASLAVNNTGRNEHLAVFTPTQWQVLHAVAQRLKPLPDALRGLVTGLRDRLTDAIRKLVEKTKPAPPPPTTTTPRGIPGGVATAPRTGYVADAYAYGTGIGAGPVTGPAVSHNPVTPPKAPPVAPPKARLTGEQHSAAKELLHHIEKGGTYFEDLSYRGNSQNLRNQNDRLADAFYASGGRFRGNEVRDWLRRILHQGHFDAGGLAKGIGILAKQTISPERVLSPRQTASFERMVPFLDRMSSRGLDTWKQFTGDAAGGRYGGQPVVVNVYPSARMDEEQLAEAVQHRLDWQMGLIS